MKHLVTIFMVSGLMLYGAIGGIAWAQSAHFVGKITATLQGRGVLVCFNEASLGSAPVELEATTDVTATFVLLSSWPDRDISTHHLRQY
jgi:hypothetical protein